MEQIKFRVREDDESLIQEIDDYAEKWCDGNRSETLRTLLRFGLRYNKVLRKNGQKPDAQLVKMLREKPVCPPV